MKIPFISNLFKRTGGSGPKIVVCFRGKKVVFIKVKKAADKIKISSYTVRELPALTSPELAKLCGSIGMSGGSYSTLLDSTEYQMQVVEAPNVPPEELKAAIRWHLKDMLTYHVDEATLDVLPIPSSNPALDKAGSVYVVAAQSVLIKKRMNLFAQANMALEVIDIPEMAQRNIAALFEDAGRGLAVLAFDDRASMLTFTGGGELYLARRIDISLGQLQDADESLRQQYFERLELEVQRSMDYFDRQFKHLSVNRLLIAAPAQAGLVERLRDNVSVPVERLDLSHVLDMSKAPELDGEEAQCDAFYALGAALRQEVQAS